MSGQRELGNMRLLRMLKTQYVQYTNVCHEVIHTHGKKGRNVVADN